MVEVYSVGEDHGQFYVVMELVDGGSLDDRMEDEKRISELQTLEVGMQVAQGLQAALKAGLIHRDIKPGNIIFADRGQAKIVDFGLVLLAGQHTETDGEIWGTPYYVAPERLTGAKEDFRSDLYSLGATLFHAVSGHPTFENETRSAAELRKLKSDPTPLRGIARDVSEQTAAVIDRMLRPDPADRLTSYQELIAELQAAHAATPSREEEEQAHWSWQVRLAVSLGALALLVALGFGAAYGWRHLNKLSTATRPVSGASATPAGVVSDGPLQTGRRELEAGRDPTAEALFRELAVTQPNVRPAAELCAGLQLWKRVRKRVNLRRPPPFCTVSRKLRQRRSWLGSGSSRPSSRTVCTTTSSTANGRTRVPRSRIRPSRCGVKAREAELTTRRAAQIEADPQLALQQAQQAQTRVASTAPAAPAGQAHILEVLKPKLVRCRDGSTSAVDGAALDEKKYVALYFSAHWCGPCRRFTPKLVEYYNQVATAHPEFEIIFVSADRSRFGWETYIRETKMPWLAVDYEQLGNIGVVKDLGGASIPSLLLLDSGSRIVASSHERKKYLGPQNALAALDKIFAAPAVAQSR